MTPKNQAITRFSDTAALVKSREGRVIAHTEFEADPRPVTLPGRMHTYGNLLYGLHDGRYPVRSTVVVLGIERANARLRALVTRQAIARFGSAHAIADLLPRCDADDLDFLAEQLLLCDSAESLRAVALARMNSR